MKKSMVFGALAFSVCAFAAQPGTQASVNTPLRPAASFGYLDIDKDSRLSRQEAKVDWAVTQRFAAADANHDGYLDAEEFKQLSRG